MSRSPRGESEGRELKIAETLCNFSYWASGAELGASGVCFPLEFHFTEILICNFKFTSLGASDAELGASGAYSPLGSHFIEIRICNFKLTSLGASGAPLGASGAELGASGPGLGASAAAASPLERDVMKI